jgi:hypothetical protein
MDIFYWKGNSFLLAVLKPFDFNMVQYIPSHHASVLKDAVMRIITKIRARGFIINTVITDPESSLKTLDGLVDVPWDTVCIFTDEILQYLADHEPKEYGIHVLTRSH